MKACSVRCGLFFLAVFCQSNCNIDSSQSNRNRVLQLG